MNIIRKNGSISQHETIVSGSGRQAENMDRIEPPPVVPYATRLPPCLIERIHRYAKEHGREDEEIVRRAVEEYLQRHRRGDRFRWNGGTVVE